MKRGEIYLVDFGFNVGSEQNGTRPCLIIQNDVGNNYSPTTIIAVITSQAKRHLPTHVEIIGSRFGLTKDSTILCEQIKTIDKNRLKMKLGELDEYTLKLINNALKISLELI